LHIFYLQFFLLVIRWIKESRTRVHKSKNSSVANEKQRNARDQPASRRNSTTILRPSPVAQCPVHKNTTQLISKDFPQKKKINIQRQSDIKRILYNNLNSIFLQKGRKSLQAAGSDAQASLSLSSPSCTSAPQLFAVRVCLDDYQSWPCQKIG
jgi:hypothetical protein